MQVLWAVTFGFVAQLAKVGGGSVRPIVLLLNFALNNPAGNIATWLAGTTAGAAVALRSSRS